MTRLSTRARATAHWMLAVLFVLFGAWAVEQWWSLLGTDAGWRSMIVPFLATLGAIALTLHQVEAARRRPAPVRLVRMHRG